jgi:hypothetical protein
MSGHAYSIQLILHKTILLKCPHQSSHFTQCTKHRTLRKKSKIILNDANSFLERVGSQFLQNISNFDHFHIVTCKEDSNSEYGLP